MSCFMPPAQVGAEGIYFLCAARPQFAPAPLVCIYKTLEIAFFSTKILGIIFWCYHNLYKFAGAIGPFRADTYQQVLAE